MICRVGRRWPSTRTTPVWRTSWRRRMDPFVPDTRDAAAPGVVVEQGAPPARRFTDIQNAARDGMVTASDGERFFVVADGHTCAVPDTLGDPPIRFAYEPGFPVGRIFAALGPAGAAPEPARSRRRRGAFRNGRDGWARGARRRVVGEWQDGDRAGADGDGRAVPVGQVDDPRHGRRGLGLPDQRRRPALGPAVPPEAAGLPPTRRPGPARAGRRRGRDLAPDPGARRSPAASEVWPSGPWRWPIAPR